MNTPSQGYQTEIDPETGLLYARFPPHYPGKPDRGFLLGLKNIAVALEQIYNEERLRALTRAPSSSSPSTHEDLAPPSVGQHKLAPLTLDSKRIFEEIFGPEEDEDFGEVST